MKEKLKQNGGITLIALAITIIVLLILAGVSIAMLTGENGILTQAQRAKEETENAQKEEENILANYESYLNSYSGENTEFTDSLGNKVIVPAGFKVVNPEDNVEDGIVIEDVAHGATSGSQFVWIPVGIINRKDKEDITITLSRYTFASETGEETNQGANLLNYHLLEVSNSSYGNTTAKEDIETEKTGFRRSAIENGGYYIGRYEARTISQRTSETNDSGLTQVTVKPNDYVYRYITQPQAAELSQNMYEDNNFESDLMNSYAWDTAITFLQKCDNRERITIPYSMQSTLNVEFASQGTNNLKTMDEICSIFDMASNCYEWTTETSDYPDSPCVIRAGGYDKTERNTAYRQRIS